MKVSTEDVSLPLDDIAALLVGGMFGQSSIDPACLMSEKIGDELDAIGHKSVVSTKPKKKISGFFERKIKWKTNIKLDELDLNVFGPFEGRTGYRILGIEQAKPSVLGWSDMTWYQDLKPLKLS